MYLPDDVHVILATTTYYCTGRRRRTCVDVCGCGSVRLSTCLYICNMGEAYVSARHGDAFLHAGRHQPTNWSVKKKEIVSIFRAPRSIERAERCNVMHETNKSCYCNASCVFDLNYNDKEKSDKMRWHSWRTLCCEDIHSALRYLPCSGVRGGYAMQYYNIQL